MKQMLVWMTLCAVTVGAGGCIISIKGDGCQPGKGGRHIGSDPTIAEIDAVKTLSTESARLNILRAIASRPGLSPAARIHLVESVKMLATESAREEVLMILAENPPMPAPPPQPQPEPVEDDMDSDH